MITDTLHARKFGGAAAEVLKESIISRELGLHEKQVMAHQDSIPVSFEIEPVEPGTYLPPEEGPKG